MIIILLLGFANVSLPCLYAQQGAREEEAFYVARKAYEDGFFEVALSLFEHFLEKFAESQKAIEVKVYIARCFLYQGRYSLAQAQLNTLKDLPEAENFKDAVFYWLGEVNFSQKQYNEASVYYQEVINNFPDSSFFIYALYSQGLCFYQKGQILKALHLFKKLSTNSFEDLAQDAALRALECLYNLKEYSELFRQAQRFQTSYPNTIYKNEVNFLLAEALFYLNKYVEAKGYYELCLSLSSDQKLKNLYFLGLVWVYLKLEDYSQAKMNLARISFEFLDKDQKQSFLLAKARILSLEKNFKEAKHLWQELLRETSEPEIKVDAFLGLAEALYNLDQPGQALLNYKEVVSLSNNEETRAVALCRIGHIYQAQGSYLSAIQTYREILDNPGASAALDELRQEATYGIAEARFSKGEFVACAEILENNIADLRNSAYEIGALYLLASSFYNQSQFEKALKVFKEIPSLAQDSRMQHRAEYMVADCLDKLGKEELAAKRFNFLRAKHTSSILTPKILLWLGDYYLRHNDFTKSLHYYQTIIRDYPESELINADLHFKIACCYEEKGSFREAIEEYLRIASRYPKKTDLVARAILSAAEVYENEEDYSKAKQLYSRLSLMDVGEAKYAQERLEWLERNQKPETRAQIK